MEVSLHNESLANEEQRAYIEVLKQALEANLTEAGLISFLKSLKENTQMDEVDLFIELNNVKTLIDHHQKERITAEDKNKDLVVQLEAVSIENDDLKSIIRDNKQNANQAKGDIEKLLTSLDAFETENQKLNQEKQSLIEYADNLRAETEGEREENADLKKQLDERVIECEELAEINSKLEERQTESERRLKLLSSDLDNVRNLSNTLEEQIKSLEEQNEIISKEYLDVKTKHETNVREKSDMEIGIAERKRDHENLQKQYNALRSEHDEQLQQLQEYQSKYNEACEQLQSLEEQQEVSLAQEERLVEQNQELRDRLLHLESIVKEVETDKSSREDLKDKAKAQEGELEELKHLMEESKKRYDKDRQSKADEIRDLFEQNSHLRSEVRVLKDQRITDEGRLQGLEHEIDEYAGQIDRKQKALLAVTTELSDLRKTLEVSKEALTASALQVEKLEGETEELRKANRVTQSKVLEIQDLNDELERKAELLKSENTSLKEEDTKLSSRIEELSRINNELKYQNQKLLDEVTQTRKESIGLLQSVEKTLAADDKSIPHSTFTSENIHSIFGALEENIKVIVLENQRLNAKHNDILSNYEMLRREHEKVLKDNETSRKR